MRWVFWFAIGGCYAPSPPLGAPCGDLNVCPAELVCRLATNTCEQPIGELPDGPGPDGPGTDTTPDALPVPLRSTFLDEAIEVDGSVTLKIPAAIPSGSMLVLEVAARGNVPITVSDSRGNVWVKDAELDNLTTTSVVGIFHVFTASALSPNDEIVAVINGSDGRAGGVALFRLEGATQLDQVGTAQDPTTTPSVSTPSLTTSPELAFGVVVTGFNSPTSYTPDQGFIEVAEFATPLSSGSFNHKTLDQPVGTFEVTATNAANFAIAIATYR